ncbi:ATP-binding protein [Bacteriovorax sp. PP10]|uniref:histidine kinase n=1 Tax=Bacteriovorax antarcticus TaxID=3088717 RepID=A0ABU5VUJ3_9BACT|nr:ATP-binding protein [Bacteriovorax sp. PP10]MEA9356721.1 ATP-binding protein [Bacteriovorax sp. PP10]
MAFILVVILFLFLDKLEDNFKFPIICLSLSVIVFNLVRFFNYKKYFAGQKLIKDAVLLNSLTILINSSIWCTLGIISILSYEANNFQILLIFIILISFSAAAIVTVSHKTLIFAALNFLILFPPALYSIFQYIQSGDVGRLWLLGYTAINLVYNLKQGKVIQEELHSRFAIEYDLKKSLEEIALSKKNLEEESIKTFHASRLSSLGEMAGGVAHEINNPLTIIQGMTKSILSHDELGLDEQTKTKLTKINAASERIAKIVKGMKIISSKNDQIEHEIVKVSKVLEISIDLYEEKFKNETIRFKLENANDPDIKCNPLQISQILINLVSNAIDALQKLDEEKYLTIKITEDPITHSVDIRVINSGPILENAVSAKIFEPFFSTKSLGKGTGLGLSISSTLAHSNHGNLSYEVYEGQVCFKLHIESHT